MCIVSKPPTPPEPPPVPDPAPPPELLEQSVAAAPQETVLEQNLAASKGLSQLRILPGIAFTQNK